MISGDLQKAAEVLVNVLLKTQKGETFVITADTACLLYTSPSPRDCS